MATQIVTADRWPRPRPFNGHWRYWFWENTYRENVHVIWPVREPERRAYLRASGRGDIELPDTPAGADDNWAGRTSECTGPPGAHVIALRGWRNDTRSNGVLAHEVFHVVNSILASRGVEFVPGSANEPFAYLTEALFRACHAALCSVPARPPVRRKRRKR